MTSTDPLLLCSRASRRLQLLFAPSARPRQAKEEQPTSASEQQGGRAQSTDQLCLEAGTLPSPPPLHWGAPVPAWLTTGDPLREVVVHLDMLRQLRVPAGSLVQVQNAERPDLVPRLARALPSPLAPRGAALLAPSLAYNLGLPLHLSSLLQHGDRSMGSMGRVLLAPYVGPPADSQGAASARTDNSKQQGGLACVALPQPAGEAASVPVAQAVHLAWVRSPAVALLASSAQKGLGTTPHSPATATTPGEGAGAASGGLAAQGESSGGASTVGDGGGEAVAALQNFFLSQTRLLTQGDILAVPMQRAGAPALSLPNLLQPDEGLGPSPQVGADCGSSNGLGLHPCFQPAHGNTSWEQPPPQGSGRGSALGLSPELMYFRVVQVLPVGVRGPLAVDTARTEVKLVGSCSSGIPPGVMGYLTPPLQAPQLDLEPRGAAAVGGGAPPAWGHLAELLASSLHPGGAHLPLRLAVLLHGPSGSGKRTTVAAAAQAVGCHVVPLSCHDIRPAGTPEKKVLEGLQAAFEAAGHYRPAVLLLRHFEAIVGDGAGGPGSSTFAARAGTSLAECIRSGFRPAPGPNSDSSSCQFEGRGEASGPPPLFPCPLVLVACVNSPDRVPPPLRRCFTHELAADAPDQAARAQLLGQALRGVGTGIGGGLGSEALEELARHTAGLLPREIRAVVADAAALAAREALPAGYLLQRPVHMAGSPPDAAPAPSLCEHHLSRALESVRQRTTTDIGAPKIPDVKWEDVGGLEDVKRAILDTVELPLKHPELFAGGLRRRSGVLLYGPPGTGKTLLAKAVATECSINFLSVKGPELINMYVGESERQIREVFARARRARPCVVFFDELDSLAPARGKGSDSGGVMDRVVAQLLAEVDGVQGGAGSGDLFIIGATNRPDLLDHALMRPGRLDRLLYVGIAGDSTSRLRVLEALTRKFALHPGVDLIDVAARCPARFTGADMYALCSDAWMTALRRGIAEHTHEGEGAVVVVEQSDFNSAIANLQPSLSEEEVRKYEQIRDQWSQQPKCVG